MFSVTLCVVFLLLCVFRVAPLEQFNEEEYAKKQEEEAEAEAEAEAVSREQARTKRLEQKKSEKAKLLDLPKKQQKKSNIIFEKPSAAVEHMGPPSLPATFPISPSLLVKPLGGVTPSPVPFSTSRCGIWLCGGGSRHGLCKVFLPSFPPHPASATHHTAPHR